MLLSPLSALKSISAAVQPWGLQLLAATSHRLSQPAVAGRATTTLQHVHCTFMTTSQQHVDQPFSARNSLPNASKAMGKGRGGRSSGCSTAAAAPPCCSTDPCSSNGSEYSALLDRPPSRVSPPATASTKSTKRKAAEALLAAQYGGLSSSSCALGSSNTALQPAAAATTSSMQRAYSCEATAAAAAARQVTVQIHKRPRSMLATAITRLGGDVPAEAAAESTPAAAAKVDVAAQAAAAAQGGHLGTQQQPQQPEQAASSWLLSQVSPAAASAARQPPANHSTMHEAAGAAAAAAAAHGAAVCVEALGAAHQQQQQQSRPQQPAVVVPACGPDCTHSLAQGWCHSQVQLPHVDWGRVMDTDMAHAPSFKVAQGYERLHMPAGVQVLLVENHAHIPAALAQLRCSMQDPVVAIDLEWRPEFGRGFTPVAMVQLATSRVAVLIRTCKMGYRLPPALRDFLKDPQVHFLGFSWASQDESKMQSTFGFGSKDFGRFLDLQQVAHGLGYHGFGLARLTRQVLGLAMPKNKKISTSNWEHVILSRSQLKYAALDVLMAGQVFRALRLWHSSPSLCEVCHYNLGTACSNVFQCQECDKTYWDIKPYVHHCERYRHKQQWAECEGCGCARELPWPATKAAEQQAADQHPSSQQSS